MALDVEAQAKLQRMKLIERENGKSSSNDQYSGDQRHGGVFNFAGMKKTISPTLLSTNNSTAVATEASVKETSIVPKRKNVFYKLKHRSILGDNSMHNIVNVNLAKDLIVTKIHD